MATSVLVATQEWAMKQFLAVAGLSVLALILMDSSQVVIGPTGLVLKAGQAMAADIAVKAPPPPPPAPVGKGKAPIIGKGKGKYPVVAARY
jgi:hypothetical protein